MSSRGRRRELRVLRSDSTGNDSIDDCVVRRTNESCVRGAKERSPRRQTATNNHKVKVKASHITYSIPSVGPGADPGVQAVSLQVTESHPPGRRLPLLSARPAVTSPSRRASPPFGRYQVILLGDRGT